jgi:hypothetical protein
VTGSGSLILCPQKMDLCVAMSEMAARPMRSLGVAES